MSGQDREQVTATSRAIQEIYVPAQDGRGRIAYAVTVMASPLPGC